MNNEDFDSLIKVLEEMKGKLGLTKKKPMLNNV